MPSPAMHFEECQRGCHLRRHLLHASAQDSANQKTTIVIIETANVTGGGKLHARLRETSAHILLGQEHHWPEARLASEAAATRRHGWETAFGAAAPSPLSATGTNGGVSVSVSSGLRLRQVACMPPELQWPPTHRFVISIVNAVLKGGLAEGSEYAHVGLGYAGENVVMFEHMWAIVAGDGPPLSSSEATST